MVKKDRSVKIALEARALKKAIHQDEYQTPNLKTLIEMTAETLASENRDIWYSSVDLKYAYCQVSLLAFTAKNCIFQIFGKKTISTYRFVKVFFGLTVMPTEFQKVRDGFLARFREVIVFIDDILSVTKETKIQHMAKVQEILNVLDLAILLVKTE